MPSKSRTEPKVIAHGDVRTFFESTTTEPFHSPNGIDYPVGTAVRGSANVTLENGAIVSTTLPSMAELLYYQSKKELEKAHHLKSRSLQVVSGNGYLFFADEASFFVYLQVFLLGILGLYASLEAMVYELYIRRPQTVVTINGETISLDKLSDYGFERKISSIASQLSGKASIFGTPLMEKAKEIANLRTNIQHWNIPYDEQFFMDIPDEHPYKKLIHIDPLEHIVWTREILDYYKL